MKPVKTSKNKRISVAFMFTFCLLMNHSSLVLADAKSDGDKGIAEFKNGNLIESMRLLEKSAEEGYVPAQVTLAYIFDQSERNSEAFKWYQQAAEANDAAGLFGLGGMYAKGEGTTADPEKAGRLIEQSALQNHLPAMRAYASALEYGQLGFERDGSSAAEWYLKAANAGDDVSMSRLKEAYTSGQLGLPVDPEQASELDARIKKEN
jgi:TPR repeat protein